ncbi:MAG: glycogen debranching enzyme N-terminal domain-containing protein [Kiritimatiellales bacterium]|nr:glycogen debranching enzyme N-terminal domain-containing protein [Kiritimatiellales bacterium]
MNGFKQTPAPGTHLINFSGDTITFTLEGGNGMEGQAWLRSNIGHARIRRNEIIRHAEDGLPPLSRDWHDIPMNRVEDGKWSLTLPLPGVGRFEAKALFIPADGAKLLWPDGGNTVIKVEPAETCAGNTMYTAFVRQFGDTKGTATVSEEDAHAVERLDAAGYAVIPKSGKFRDLIKELDFIVGTLRCRIVQLLPIHPVPTSYARMGRFGSPFAALDLMDVDPALAEFDKETTPLDQFQELVDEMHRRNARLYLDMPINHTGWASHLQVNHPEWFHRNEDGSFMSPGAWGVLWEDLSKLDYSHRGLWKYMAEVFLFWCRRGVDGFRCDAGYKIPFAAWEYIIARVRDEYPDTIFMLEGLGGYKHVTEGLLADSGMNWAYSEIFQNYDQGQVEHYLPESIRVSESKGNLIHFSETHDNARLAATSLAFARLRTAFCALTCHAGAFGFANGVEWYATEKIKVHNSPSLNWGADENMIDFIRRLHAIMETHPSFFAGGTLRMIQEDHRNCIVLLRHADGGNHPLLVLANLDHENESEACWNPATSIDPTDLLTGGRVQLDQNGQQHSVRLGPGRVICLTDEPEWNDAVIQALEKDGTHLPERARQQVLRAKALEISGELDADPAALAKDPKEFCSNGAAPCVTSWVWPRDNRRTVMVPPEHVLLATAEYPFIAELQDKGDTIRQEKALQRDDGTFFALFQPLEVPSEHRELTLKLTVFEPEKCRKSESPVLLLSDGENALAITRCGTGIDDDRDRYAICTNQHGALSQVRMAWGEIRSKYDALLSANLNDAYPIDRHTLFTRCRGWIVCRDYSTELAIDCQTGFAVADDGTVTWSFEVPCGEGRLVPLDISLKMYPDRNAIGLNFQRLEKTENPDCLADEVPVRLILRPHLEDRCNHEVTKAYAGPEELWPAAIKADTNGFVFSPASDRQLHVSLTGGQFHHEVEWYYMIKQEVDAARGMDGHSDLFSPGYFTAELIGGDGRLLTASTEGTKALEKTDQPKTGSAIALSASMEMAMRQFIVKRDECKTVIAGYPWFLDWGRDTLICLRGIIAAGMLKESRDILVQFARFEKDGTIPNMIRGNDDANRETSDAPLWFFVACADLLKAEGSDAFLKEDCGGRTILQVLGSLAQGYSHGTANGIKMDSDSGLVFSPSHFTWMDTNYPAGTPREGYPIEIQALWLHALKMLEPLEPAANWKALIEKVEASISELFIIDNGNERYLADCLRATPGTPARQAVQDDTLRSNQLLAVTLGAVTDPDLCKSIVGACEELLVPGGIRSLADRPVRLEAPIYRDGELLNDPKHPYWGRYSGDEDTRRKPAYHNGTAWSWPFPSYCEALVMAYGKTANRTALSILSSASVMVNSGCLRHIPEVMDGNAPHTPRGCGAQAWGATELFRVMELLKTR